MDIFSRIAERKIVEAMDQGVFDDLPGKGRPLVFEDDTWVPEDLRAVYRILKNSGYVPPELELRNEILNLKILLDTIDDDTERLKKLRELNFKIMHLDILRKRPLNLKDFPEYEDRIIEKITSS